MFTLFVILALLYVVTALISIIILIDLDEYVYLNLRDQDRLVGMSIRYSRELIRKANKFKRYLWLSFIPVVNIFAVYRAFMFVFSINKEENKRISRKIIAVGKSPVANTIRKIKKSCQDL